MSVSDPQDESKPDIFAAAREAAREAWKRAQEAFDTYQLEGDEASEAAWNAAHLATARADAETHDGTIHDINTTEPSQGEVEWYGELYQRGRISRDTYRRACEAWCQLNYERDIWKIKQWHTEYDRLVKPLLADPDAEQPKQEQQQQQTTEEIYVTTHKSHIKRDFVWCTAPAKFIRRADGVMWNPQQFDANFNPLVEKASASKAVFKSKNAILRFDFLTFHPAGPELNGRYYNTWRKSKIEPAEGDTTAWNAHLADLWPDAEDRNHALDWMAWVYQHQAIKPNFAMLIVGEAKGTGKSFIARVMEQLIGPDNTKRPKNSSLRGDFNGWAAQCKLCVIEELMHIGKREVANELRDMITESPIEINIKNVPAFQMDNYMAMMAISNHFNAIPIDENERRWLVLRTAAQPKFGFGTPKSKAHYSKLADALGIGRAAGTHNDPAALPAIAWELAHRSVSADYGLGNAPETKAKETMADASLTDVPRWLRENAKNYPLTLPIVHASEDVLAAMPADLRRERGAVREIIDYLVNKRNGVKHQSISLRKPDGKYRTVDLYSLDGYQVRKSWAHDYQATKAEHHAKQPAEAPGEFDLEVDILS
jgi:hypothetical protein